MGEWFKKFWTDPAFFTAAIRGLIAVLGSLIASGIIPTEGWKYGFIVMALAQLIPAGNKTPPLKDRFAQATPEDLAALKQALAAPPKTG